MRHLGQTETWCAASFQPRYPDVRPARQRSDRCRWPWRSLSLSPQRRRSAPSSVLSIRYPGHTRLWTGGGASAGGEIGWLTSGWIPPTRFLPIRIEDPLAMPIGGTGERFDNSRQPNPSLVLVQNWIAFS